MHRKTATDQTVRVCRPGSFGGWLQPTHKCSAMPRASKEGSAQEENTRQWKKGALKQSAQVLKQSANNTVLKQSASTIAMRPMSPHMSLIRDSVLQVCTHHILIRVASDTPAPASVRRTQGLSVVNVAHRQAKLTKSQSRTPVIVCMCSKHKLMKPSSAAAFTALTSLYIWLTNPSLAYSTKRMQACVHCEHAPCTGRRGHTNKLCRLH